MGESVFVNALKSHGDLQVKESRGGCQNAINYNKQLIIKTVSEEKSAGNPTPEQLCVISFWKKTPVIHGSVRSSWSRSALGDEATARGKAGEIPPVLMINNHQSLGRFNMTPATCGILTHGWKQLLFLSLGGVGVKKEVRAQHTKGESFYTPAVVALYFGWLFWANHAEFSIFSVVTTTE